MLFFVQFERNPSTSATEVAERLKRIRSRRISRPKILGGWFTMEGTSGFAVVEADDASLLAATFLRWTDLVKFTLTPVLSVDQFLSLADDGNETQAAPEQ